MLYLQSMNSPKLKKSSETIMKTGTALPRGYARFLADLKGRIRSAQIKASLAESFGRGLSRKANCATGC